jgi:hypothetical protein
MPLTHSLVDKIASLAEVEDFSAKSQLEGARIFLCFETDHRRRTAQPHPAANHIGGSGSGHRGSIQKINRQGSRRRTVRTEHPQAAVRAACRQQFARLRGEKEARPFRNSSTAHRTPVGARPLVRRCQSTPHAAHQALAFEELCIAVRGHRGYPQRCNDFFDTDRAARTQLFQDKLASLFRSCIHEISQF